MSIPIPEVVLTDSVSDYLVKERSRPMTTAYKKADGTMVNYNRIHKQKWKYRLSKEKAALRQYIMKQMMKMDYKDLYKLATEKHEFTGEV